MRYWFLLNANIFQTPGNSVRFTYIALNDHHFVLNFASRLNIEWGGCFGFYFTYILRDN